MLLGAFLQALSFDSTDAPPLIILISLIAALGIFIFFTLLLAVYIYLSFAYSSIGKKAHLKNPGIAWIPAIGPLIITHKSSKMHWWPWLLIVGLFIPIINIFANLVFTIFIVIWHWKMFEYIKKPNWWAILMLIPIVNLVVIGIAAWSKK